MASMLKLREKATMPGIERIRKMARCLNVASQQGGTDPRHPDQGRPSTLLRQPMVQSMPAGGMPVEGGLQRPALWELILPAFSVVFPTRTQ